MKFNYLKIVVLIALIVLLIPHILNFADDVRWMCASFIDPNLNKRYEERFASFKNEDLLKKLRSLNERTRGFASSELVRRKEKSLAPIYYKMLASRLKNEKWTAIYALVELGDKTVISYLVNELNSKDFYERKIAVKELSRFQYQLIIPEIKRYAEMPKTEKYGEIPKNNAVSMAENFGNNPETIAILKSIAADKSTILASYQAEEALKRIESKSVSNNKSNK